MQINGCMIGKVGPPYIVAEMSANHCRDFEKAKEIIRQVADTGADAIKVQTLDPDTITLNHGDERFKISKGSWAGYYLHDLYKLAAMPWTWLPDMANLANDLGLDFFSTVYDYAAVDFLQEYIDPPAYKIASFELVDTGLLQYVANRGKPVIVSTGMSCVGEIEEAERTLIKYGAESVCLLKCTSAYPARPFEMALRAMPLLPTYEGTTYGLSDHTQSLAVPVAATVLGAAIIEKHVMLAGTDSLDCGFSLTVGKFSEMAQAVRETTGALSGAPNDMRLGRAERAQQTLRRSLFVIQDVHEGERFTSDNVASIRPADGLHPRELPRILGCRAVRDVSRGTPLTWDLICDPTQNNLPSKSESAQTP